MIDPSHAIHLFHAARPLDSYPARRGVQKKVSLLRHQLATELNKLSNAIRWDGEFEAASKITTFELGVANWLGLGLGKDG
ncbi:Uncharacterized protein HZ326_24640 [Fusarium oxysporum f. sp. albedinis]|nr:Uncharacterized protein HZ326_24640 [Fusarium oxysporum f. sp. albedinis]